MVTDISTALTLERSGEAKILMRFGDLVKDFHIHVIFATNKVIAQKPDALRGFLKGWFETIGFMRANKAESVDIAKDVIGKDAEITGRTYDALMPMFSNDGRFDPRALGVLAKSYVELKVLPEAPDPKQLITEAFLPAR
jgi:NitT/TauT family transport system substrate-binding protein